jgi:hypothetical protein
MALSSCLEGSVPRREEKRREENAAPPCMEDDTRRFGPSRREVLEALDGIDVVDNRKEIVHVVLSV